MHQFDRNLENFHTISPNIQGWIDNISKEKWSQTYDIGRYRNEHMTTNLSDAVNKILEGARNLPITTLVKYRYVRMVQCFVERGAEARQSLELGIDIERS